MAMAVVGVGNPLAVYHHALITHTTMTTTKRAQKMFNDIKIYF